MRAVQPEISAPLVLVDARGTKVDSRRRPERRRRLGSGGRIAHDAAELRQRARTAGGGSGRRQRGRGDEGPHPHRRPRHGRAREGRCGAGHGQRRLPHRHRDRWVHRRAVHPAQATRLFTDGTHLTALDIAADRGVSQQTLTARVAKVLPPSLQAETGRQVRDDATQQVSSALSFVNYILLGFGIVALIVGTFIIYNTFSMIVAQRLRELALLRAIGADRRQMRRSVLLEATLMGLLGSVLGVARRGGSGLRAARRARRARPRPAVRRAGLSHRARSSSPCCSAWPHPAGCLRPRPARLADRHRWRPCARSSPRPPRSACAGAA